MNDLAEVLRAQAAATHPHPDLDDALRRARARRRHTVARRALAALAVVLAVSAGVVASQRNDDHRDAVVAGAPGGLPGLAIGTPDAHGKLDRRDSQAEQGPWTVILRRADGSLGSHGAVVTFPVPILDLFPGRRVTVRGAPGSAHRGEIVWPIGGAFARVQGDLGDTRLLEIARRTSIVRGRPRVRAPKGLSVVFTGPYRAPLAREARYGSVELGEGDSLGHGLTYTGVVRAGGFEDQLYARHRRDQRYNTHRRGGSRVHGRPAVLSSVQGGNDTLAWELAPGLVAYVGYSGNSLDDAAARALTRLAERARLVSPVAWQPVTQTVEQVNDFG